MSSDAARELSLNEWVGRLFDGHTAVVEYKELQAKLAAAEADRDELEVDVARLAVEILTLREQIKRGPTPRVSNKEQAHATAQPGMPTSYPTEPDEGVDSQPRVCWKHAVLDCFTCRAPEVKP